MSDAEFRDCLFNDYHLILLINIARAKHNTWSLPLFVCVLATWLFHIFDDTHHTNNLWLNFSWMKWKYSRKCTSGMCIVYCTDADFPQQREIGKIHWEIHHCMFHIKMLQSCGRMPSSSPLQSVEYIINAICTNPHTHCLNQAIRNIQILCVYDIWRRRKNK